MRKRCKSKSIEGWQCELDDDGHKIHESHRPPTPMTQMVDFGSQVYKVIWKDYQTEIKESKGMSA
jgi:hypothetical protein